MEENRKKLKSSDQILKLLFIKILFYKTFFFDLSKMQIEFRAAKKEKFISASKFTHSDSRLEATNAFTIHSFNQEIKSLIK